MQIPFQGGIWVLNEVGQSFGHSGWKEQGWRKAWEREAMLEAERILIFALRVFYHKLGKVRERLNEKEF